MDAPFMSVRWRAQREVWRQAAVWPEINWFWARCSFAARSRQLVLTGAHNVVAVEARRSAYCQHVDDS